MLDVGRTCGLRYERDSMLTHGAFSRSSGTFFTVCHFAIKKRVTVDLTAFLLEYVYIQHRTEDFDRQLVKARGITVEARKREKYTQKENKVHICICFTVNGNTAN